MSPAEVDRDEEDSEHGTEGAEVEESIGQERGHAPPEGLVHTGPEPESYPSFVQEESQKLLCCLSTGFHSEGCWP